MPAGGRLHAYTSIRQGAAGEICLFGYANHNADRLTQQITQFHCACHIHILILILVVVLVLVLWSAGDMRAAAEEEAPGGSHQQST